ncbi:conserved hypothetical protein [Neospora caninum Liverpool]|uniref:Uncharacterized protein n=1 Tax=Neospora caninum (strain Liverpool) TaxID=572307 RepID=F0V7C7_NEOCL|nr:conserved hypothetical protein [Neospora caninum Liverpool]CBZ49618.1 conserved hypothetical protein [Neospora caninum Liverpool]CEL64199.1 TPA: hypothetical protein BN1204_001110 [Neospora caninum Liverpool]|eukprot:XP_003879653.1 conserved hypothetical protein [Neospora caninum Liverpool]
METKRQPACQQSVENETAEEEGLEIRETPFGLEQRWVYRHLDRRHEEIDESVFRPAAFDPACRLFHGPHQFYTPLPTPFSLLKPHGDLQRKEQNAPSRNRDTDAETSNEEEDQDEEHEEKDGLWRERGEAARPSRFVAHCGETAMVSLLIVGDQNAGKSTFLHAFCRDRLGARFLQLTSFLPFLQASFSNTRLVFLRERDFQEKAEEEGQQKRQETSDEESGCGEVLSEERTDQPNTFEKLASSSSSSSSSFSSSSSLEHSSALLSFCRDERPFLDSDVARALVLFTLEDFLFFCSEFSIAFSVLSPSSSPSSSSSSLRFSALTRYVALHLLELGGDHLDRLLHFFEILRQSKKEKRSHAVSASSLVSPSEREGEEKGARTLRGTQRDAPKQTHRRQKVEDTALEAARTLLRAEKRHFRRLAIQQAVGPFRVTHALELSASKQREDEGEKAREKEELVGDQEQEDRDAQELLRVLSRSVEMIGDAEQVVYFVNCQSLFPSSDSQEQGNGARNPEEDLPTTDASEEKDERGNKKPGQATGNCDSNSSSSPPWRSASPPQFPASCDFCSCSPSCYSPCSPSCYSCSLSSSFGLLSVDAFVSLLRKLHALGTLQSFSHEDSSPSSTSVSAARQQGFIFACNRLPEPRDPNNPRPLRASPSPSSPSSSSPSSSSPSSSSPSSSSPSSSSASSSSSSSSRASPLWFRQNFRRAVQAVHCVSRAPESSVEETLEKGEEEEERKEEKLYAEFERILESVRRQRAFRPENEETSAENGDSCEGEEVREEQVSWTPFEEDETTGERWVCAMREEERQLYQHPVFLFLSAFFCFLWSPRRSSLVNITLSSNSHMQRSEPKLSLDCLSRFQLRGVFPLRLLTEDQRLSPSSPSPSSAPSSSSPAPSSPVTSLSGVPSSVPSVLLPFSVASLVRFLVRLLQCFCQDAPSSAASHAAEPRLLDLPSCASALSSLKLGSGDEVEVSPSRPEEPEETEAGRKRQEEREEAVCLQQTRGRSLTGELGRLTLLAFLRVVEKLRNGTRSPLSPTPSPASLSSSHTLVRLWISGADFAEGLEDEHDHSSSAGRSERNDGESDGDFLPPSTVLNAFPLLARGLVGISAASPFSRLADPFPPTALELQWEEQETGEREGREGRKGGGREPPDVARREERGTSRRRSLLIRPVRCSGSPTSRPLASPSSSEAVSCPVSGSSSSRASLSQPDCAVRLPFHPDLFRLVLSRLRREASCGPLPGRFWEILDAGHACGGREEERKEETRNGGKEGRVREERRPEGGEECRRGDSQRQTGENQGGGIERRLEMDTGPEQRVEGGDTEEGRQGREEEERKTELPKALLWTGDADSIRRVVGAAALKQLCQLGSCLSLFFEKRRKGNFQRKEKPLDRHSDERNRVLKEEDRSCVQRRREEEGEKEEDEEEDISSILHSLCDDAHVLLQLAGDLSLLGSCHADLEHCERGPGRGREEGEKGEENEGKETREQGALSWIVERWRPCVEADPVWTKVVVFLPARHARKAREREESALMGDRGRGAAWMRGFEELWKALETRKESGQTPEDAKAPLSRSDDCVSRALDVSCESPREGQGAQDAAKRNGVEEERKDEGERRTSGGKGETSRASGRAAEHPERLLVLLRDLREKESLQISSRVS